MSRVAWKDVLMSVVPYEVTVNRIEGAVIYLTVRLIHIDFLTFPVSKTFGFQLLGEPMLDTRENRALGRGMPLTHALDWEDFLDRAYIIEYAGGFIASVELKATENYPITEEDLYNALVSDDPVRQVTGSYQITVTHPGWTLHLKPGMTFQSTAIDFGDGDIWSGPPRIPGDTTWLRAVNQAEGFDLGFKDDFSTFSADYLVPTRGASYYDPDPIWIGAEITPDILHSLLYQPVVLRMKDVFRDTYAGLLVEVTETGLLLYQQKRLSRRGRIGLSIRHLIYIGVARYRIPLIHG
jgi:hypothetical protein